MSARIQPKVGDKGICRACLLPVWWEKGEVGRRERIGWSDRLNRSGDSLVCFQAINFRHKPLEGRELAIYRAGIEAGKLIEVAS